MDNPYLSVVVPFYNEKETARSFHAELVRAAQGLSRSCEIIYVNDGSDDSTGAILAELAAACPLPITLVDFKRNYGQTAGLQAGFDHASGDIIITMDGDLQHDPAEIPNFIQKVEEGFDVVSGWRVKRADDFWSRRLPSLAANKMIAYITGTDLHDFGTTFKAYRKEAVKDLSLYGELHRFIPAILSLKGASIHELPIKDIVRPGGMSKYGLSRTFRVLFDIITLTFLINFSTRPMHFLGTGGLICILSGAISLAAIVLGYLFYDADLRGTMQISIMLILVGIQLFAVGLVAEMLSRVYYETTGKKIYSVRSVRKFTVRPADPAGGASRS